MNGFCTTFLALCLATLAPAAMAQTDAPAGSDAQVQPSDQVSRNVVVRAAPSTEAIPLDALRPGETLALTGELADWYQVELPTGRKGFVSKIWTNAAQTGPAGFRVHVIDVGTGLAMFVEGPGFTLVYDAGSNDDSRTGLNNRALAYIRRVRPGLATIDHLVLSHAHKDHLQLLPDIFDAYAIRNVWDSGRLYDSCGYRRFLQKVAAEPGVAFHTGLGVEAMHSFTFTACAATPKTIAVPLGSPLTQSTIDLGGGARLTFLYVDTHPYADPNENSVVVRLDLAGRRILLMGDAEAGSRQLPSSPPQAGSIEAKLLDCCRAALAADVLVAGHHGSMTSSRAAFLDAVGAKTFIISSGPYQYSGTSLPDAVIKAQFTQRGTLLETDGNDAQCALNPAKIGRDADGKPGGCDNIRIDITAAGVLQTSYQRLAD